MGGEWSQDVHLSSSPLTGSSMCLSSVPLNIVPLSLLVPLLWLLAPDKFLSLHPVLIFRSPLSNYAPQVIQCGGSF